MTKSRYAVLVLAFLLFGFFFIGQASAWSQTPVTYYNNWNNSGIVTNLELDNMNPDKYPYKWDFDLTNWYFYKNDDTLTLPKAIIDTIRFYPDRISFNITTTKEGVVYKSVANGTGQRYINIPDSALKLRFVFDNVKPDILIDNGTNQWYADPSTYWYSNVDGQIRFNFQIAPYVLLAASDEITFIFNSWLIDNAIVSGLTDVGLNSAPTVFTNNSILYLISGNSDGLFNGFNWTGSTWQSDTNIVSGLPDIGSYSTPIVFTNNSILYLISGKGTGLWTGFNWTGSTWQSDTNIVSGLPDIGSYSTPIVFTNNSILYLISGNSDGLFNGFNWTGSTWQSDTNIVSGLTDVGSMSVPSVFTNNSILHLISGNWDGLFNGFNWTGSTWQSDTNIVSGLTDVGSNSAPTVFTNNSILYLISGEYDGVFNGWNTTYSSGESPPPNPQPNITSWSNDNTSNEALSLSVNQNTNVTFNITANQTLTSCSWTGATQINCSSDSYAYKLFDTVGTQYVNFTGSNANGSTLNTVNWTITVNELPVIEYIPPIPINLVNTTGNFWVNYTWEAGTGNITNSYNVSQNGTWTNGSSNNWSNGTLSPHGWRNISVHAFNSSGNGTLNQTPISMNTQLSNNAPAISFIDPTPANASTNTTGSVQINTTVSDADNDNMTALLNWNNSLVGWWRMNEAAGGTLVQDFSGKGNNGTWYGNTTRNVTTGQFGNALAFDGVDDYVDASNNASLNITGALTLGIWINSSGLVGNDGGLISKSSDGYKYFGTAVGRVYEFGILDNVIYFQLSNGTTKVMNSGSSTEIIDSKWHFVVATWDGTTNTNGMKIYFDNVLKYQQTSTISSLQTVSSVLDIGGYTTVYNFNGSIDEVRIYNRALSQDEINASYNAGSYRLNVTMSNLSNGEYNYTAYVQDSYGTVTATEKRYVTVGTLYERTATDSIIVTEGAARTLYSFRAASDSITITEKAQRIYYGFRSVSDIATITEYASATFTDIGETFTRYASDTITVVEGTVRQLTYVRTISDSISVTEGAQRFLSAFRSVSDIVSVTDSAIRIAIYNRAVQQAITVSETVQSSITEAGELFIRYVSDTITVTESAVRSWWAGVYYTVSGYVYNILSSPLEDARVEYTGSGRNYSFTDVAGYYSITVPADTDGQILSRAIGYMNSTNMSTINEDTTMNFTLEEKEWATSNDTGAAGTMGFIGGIIGGVIALSALKKYWRA